MVKVSDSKSTVQPNRSKKDQRGGAKKWTLSHLPPGSAVEFTDVLVPLARRKAGISERPWTGLNVEEVQNLVDTTYGAEKYVVRKDDVWCDLVCVKLVLFSNLYLLLDWIPA